MLSFPTADLFNAGFELAGGLIMFLNVWRLCKDKSVRGVDWRVPAFFAVWGFWNLGYYPMLGQWFSLGAGLIVTVSNVVYCSLLVYYLKKEKANGK